MRDFPNALSDSLEKDVQFNKEIQASILKAFNAKEETLVSTEKIEAKVINGLNNINYLVVKNTEESQVNVYFEKIEEYNESNPFNYLVGSLKENGKCYSYAVYSFSMLEKKEELPSWESIADKIESGNFAEGSQEMTDLLKQMQESLKSFRKNMKGKHQ